MPKKFGKLVYQESLASLMAHTIRAITNHLLQRGIELDIRIIADKANAVIPREPDGTISVLRTTWRQIAGINDRLIAYIFIHQHANRCLARICIAHEIYHLLLEFNAFVDGDRREWRPIKLDDKIEKECNEFAWELLKAHDDFNKNENFRREYLYFPKGLFDKPLSIRGRDGWPEGVKLDPDNPFYEPPKIQEISQSAPVVECAPASKSVRPTAG